MNILERVGTAIWALGGGLEKVQSSGINFFGIKGIPGLPDIEIKLDSIAGISNAYNRCSSLRSIVNKNAMALANGKWWVVDKKDNDVLNKYKGIRSLLAKPNPLQSWSEFISLAYVMWQIHGEVFIHAVTPVGFGVDEASALWVINPANIDIKLSNKMYDQSDKEEIVLGYYLNNGVRQVKLENKDVLHIRDLSQNIGFSPTDVRGKSRLCGLESTIRNIIQAEEAIYSLNKDRGAQGMLVNKTKNVTGSVPLLPGEKDKIQQDYKMKYGLGVDQDKVLITNSDLEWKQMTFNVRDLMLFEGIDANIQRLSDAFDYPYELLANAKGSTYANRLEAKRDWYQNTIIPTANYFAECLTSFFGLSRDSFVVDYSDVECMKKTESEKADAQHKQNQAWKIMVDSGAASIAEWRLAAGMDEEIYKPDKRDENRQQNTTEAGNGQE